MPDLANLRALVIGIANDKSIATGCARALAQAGARLAVTYLNDKAKPFVEPVARELGAELLLPLDVEAADQPEALLAEIARTWGGLDVIVHSVAFAPRDDLHGPVTRSTREGFARAMDVSCHSFLRLLGAAAPLMPNGGAAMTVSYYGAEKAVAHYGIMGPVKAALEAAVRYAAVELGPQGISVNALSPGPLATRAASGIDHFGDLMQRAAEVAPEGRLVTIDEVGALAAFLASRPARAITGEVIHVDAGYNVVG